MKRLVLALVAACGAHAHVRAPQAPPAGISIALYAGATSYAVVDDRRWIDVADRALVLDHIDPGAALASLVIEPYGAGTLHVTACERDRVITPAPPPQPVTTSLTARELAHRTLARRLALRRLELARRGVRLAPEPPSPAPPPVAVAGPPAYAPVVRCTVDGPPGRYLVRVLYVSTTLGYRAEHEVVLASPAKATVVTRFAITTPAWREYAEVVLFDGMPGGERPPVEVARGRIALDGSIAMLTTPVRDVAAELRRVYDGAVVSDIATDDPAWGRDSHTNVWVWLELAKLHLPPGAVHVHVDLAGEGTRDVDVADTARAQDDAADAPLRLPLWIDSSLHALRQRFVDYSDGETLSERLVLGIGNTGDAPREVWVVEHLRPARRRVLDHAWPAPPAIIGDVARTRLVIPPGKVERLGFTARYGF